MGLSIMLVEDNAEDRLMLEQILVANGHRMSWAETVRGAEKLLQTETFGLVILDVELRDGESGIQIAHRVPRGVPVFIRSGHSTAHILQSAASVRHPLAGVSIILGKPDIDGLMREIRRLERMSSEFPSFDSATRSGG
jgi:DNA-binding NtrC family response regulator